MSPQALALFRLLERLSRRSGYACVKLLETLATMFKRSLSTTRARLAELLAVGWIARTQTRKGGKSKLFFKPLVRVAGRSRGLFLALPSGGCSGGYSPQKLAVTPSTHSKTAPVGKETTSDTKEKTGSSPESKSCPVAVVILKEVCTESEALELAREAGKHSLTEEQVKRVIAAYRQAKNVLNRGAWLREALRRGFSPAAPVSDHASDQGGVPVAKKVILTKEQLFGNHRQQAQAGNTPGRPQEPILGAPEAPMGKDRFRAEMMALRARG
ncbi:hypothetical protein [Armatimonas sp.]|uniref:hypothetical protein n=1 Tax=Armatimonas sp. TaxID=1872638 RepID=UPI003752EE6D